VSVTIHSNRRKIQVNNPGGNSPLFQYQADKELLQDRIILVTGADTDLGETVAISCANHGATVILLGAGQRRLEAVYDKIEQSGAPQPALMPLKLTKASEASFTQLTETLDSEFGRLDGLAHCDIDIGVLSPLSLYDLPTFSRVLAANVNAPYLLTRSCLGLLNKSDNASILFTSSEAGRTGKPFWGAYGIACFAIEGMMQTWAAELADDTAIRANSLATGPIRTTLRARAYPGEDPSTLKTPDEIMGAYLFLLGPESQHISGQSLHAQEPLPSEAV
jgi:NAD(P)-dependent dehydrogenase (short-subunit alcohol dehydrogenase family)